MEHQSVCSGIVTMNLITVGGDCQVLERIVRQWFSAGSYAKAWEATFYVASAIFIAEQFALA